MTPFYEAVAVVFGMLYTTFPRRLDMGATEFIASDLVTDSVQWLLEAGYLYAQAVDEQGVPLGVTLAEKVLMVLQSVPLSEARCGQRLGDQLCGAVESGDLQRAQSLAQVVLWQASRWPYVSLGEEMGWLCSPHIN